PADKLAQQENHCCRTAPQNCGQVEWICGLEVPWDLPCVASGSSQNQDSSSRCDYRVSRLPAARKLAGEKGNPKVPPSPPCNPGRTSGGCALPGMLNQAPDPEPDKHLGPGAGGPDAAERAQAAPADSSSLPAGTLPKVSYRR